MQGINPPTPAQLRAAGQLPLAKFELYFPDNRLGTMNFDSGSVEPQVNEILTGATSGATAKVFSVNLVGGAWGAGTATGSIELRDCSGCFNNNEDINGSVGGANILTVNHPDGAVGVDKHVNNGAFVDDNDPPADWAPTDATLTTEAGGQIGNCIKIVATAIKGRAIQIITVIPGKNYRYTFYYKNTAGDVARWRIYDISNGADIVAYTDLPDSIAWSSAQVYTFEAPAGCNSIAIYLVAKTNTDIVYFDEVTLYELDEWINLCDLDSKNYVEDWSISLGGASPTPNPIGGTWSATLFNEDGIFHPQHPTSAYKAYCTTERLARISVGATYGGTDYYWQRIIGYMDEPKFSIPDYRVAISGGDYMKRLQETELRMPNNYWGSTWTTSSIASDGSAGIEQYNEADAMDITGEVGNVANWTPSECTFVSFADVTGGSAHIGKMITTAAEPLLPTVVNNNIFVPVVGRQYALKFKHVWKAGAGATLRVRIVQFDATWRDIAQIEELYNRAAHNDITGVTPGGAGAGDFSIDGDWTSRYLAGNTIEVTDSTGNDGTYTISAGGSVFAAGITTIPVDEAVPNAVADGMITIMGAWWDEVLYFTAVSVNPIQIWLEIYESPIGSEFWVDQFSVFEFVSYWERYYELRGHDANEKGVHHVTLKPNAAWEDVWQGEGDEGWDYAEDAEPGPDPPAHPAGIVFFDPNKTVAAGVDNLKIYYFLATAPEDAVARILYLAGVFDPATNVPYVNEAAAKAAMVAAPGYAATGITIDKIWFEPGTTSLDAIKKLCERGNAASVQYVFYFTYDGQPVFKPRPTVGAADFAFTGPEHIASVKTYQNRNEIKNRIIIKGMKQAEPVGYDETRPSVWRGEDSDAGSIGSYGERTLTIDNHLFQTQASINAMCTALLAKYKDPKWYSDPKIPFNPAPLEIGDSMSWIERLSPTLNAAVKTGLIRDIKIDNFNTIYKCEA